MLLLFKLSIFLFGLIGIDSQQNSSAILSLERLIDNASQNALKYEYHTDAREYEAPENPIEEVGTYDFVIIGAGITGCAVTNRLTEIGEFKVALIEAGNFSDNGIIKIPGYFGLGALSDHNWGFKTVPQRSSGLGVVNGRCSLARGKGVGGTSLINSLNCVRPNPKNFDYWAKILNDPSWSYSNVLKYFKKSEHFHWTNPEAPVNLNFHGTSGLLQVQERLPGHPIDPIFLEANKEIGYNLTDYNSLQQIGGSILQIYTRNGSREDFGSVFVTPFLGRPNLKVFTDSYVTKIEINKSTKIAESVLFTKEGKTYRIKAKKEIILSAGSISNPPILMHSGVGPRKHLEDLGIEVIEDLEVGSHYREQGLAVNFLFSSNLSIPEETLRQKLEEYLKGYGPLTSASNHQIQAVGFYNVEEKNNSIADVVINLNSEQVNVFDQKLFGWNNETFKSFTKKIANPISFSIFLLTPKSEGTLRIKSKDPFEYPLIDPGVLSDSSNSDIRTLYLGIKRIFELAQTEAFKKINLKYALDPLPACNHFKFKTRKYWYCHLRQVTLPAYHSMCTCPMGTNRIKGAVLDSNLKVYGVEKLRVADASVFPEVIQGYPAMTCLMIGEKISDVIKAKYC